MNSLSIPTLFLVIGMVSAMCTLITFMLWRINRDMAGVFPWFLAALANTAGFFAAFPFAGRGGVEQGRGIEPGCFLVLVGIFNGIEGRLTGIAVNDAQGNGGGPGVGVFVGKGFEAFPAAQNFHGMAFLGTDSTRDDRAWGAAQFQGMVDHGVVLGVWYVGADGVGRASDLVAINGLHGRGQ